MGLQTQCWVSTHKMYNLCLQAAIESVALIAEAIDCLRLSIDCGQTVKLPLDFVIGQHGWLLRSKAHAKASCLVVCWWGAGHKGHKQSAESWDPKQGSTTWISEQQLHDPCLQKLLLLLCISLTLLWQHKKTVLTARASVFLHGCSTFTQSNIRLQQQLFTQLSVYATCWKLE